MKPEEARSALDDVERVKSRLALRSHWPFWRHLLYGCLMGLVVAGSGFDGWIAVSLYAAALGLTLFVVRLDRSRFGMFVSGYRGTRTKWALAGSIALAGGGAAWTHFVAMDPRLDPVFAFIVVGAIVVVVVAGSTALSIWWERLYRADLAAKDRP